jgi:hypothetical protein
MIRKERSIRKAAKERRVSKRMKTKKNLRVQIQFNMNKRKKPKVSPSTKMVCPLMLSTAKVIPYHRHHDSIVCSVPPEYCMVDKKDYTECKNWLRNTHPLLFQSIYPDEEVKEGEPAKSGSQEEEKKEEVKQPKQKKKVGFGTANPEVKVYKTKRGQKKTVCSIVGLEHFGVNLKDMAK